MLEIRSILVPVDFSEGSADALRYALALRRGERALAARARVEAVHALDLGPADDQGHEAAALRDRRHRRLRSFVHDAVGHGEPELTLELALGEAPSALAARAREYDLVVVGATGRRGPDDLVPGGVAEAVVRRSPAPVIVVKRPPGRGALAAGNLAAREIVFATDFTPFSAEALRHAMAFAFAYGGRLTAIHVVPDRGAVDERSRLPFPLAESIDRFYEQEIGWQRDELGRFLHDRLGADRPVEVREVVRAGRPAEEIARECALLRADLLVLATHGRSGLSRMLVGSVAERAIRLAPCPVLTVRPAAPAPPQA